MKIYYRDLPTWKYQLEYDWATLVDIRDHSAKGDFYRLYPTGSLIVSRGYCWDGPSGPTFDTKSFMRGSVVHDVLYQMIRRGELPSSYRKQADLELDKLLKEDGMFWLRRKMVYRALRIFAGGAADPNDRPVKHAP